MSLNIEKVYGKINQGLPFGGWLLSVKGVMPYDYIFGAVSVLLGNYRSCYLKLYV